MKVIFLDFDGVLNGDDFLQTQVLSPLRPALDPVCCARIQRICEATGASLVISSSWREIRTFDGDKVTIRASRPIEEIESWLRDAGITASVLGATSIAPMGVSENDPELRRAWQILAWTCDRPELSEWVAIDDCDLPDTDIGPRNFVGTDMATGIAEADVERAILMLGEVTP